MEKAGLAFDRGENQNVRYGHGVGSLRGNLRELGVREGLSNDE